MTNENTLYLRNGSYEFSETEIDKTLNISAYNNEVVTFDGTRSIEDLRDTNHEDGNWSSYSKEIVLDNNSTTTVE